MTHRICVFVWLLAWPALAAAQEDLAFQIRWLAIDANEGCDVGDIDGDNRPDVVAGRNWYRNGDWTPRPIRSFGDVNQYAESNCDFLWDVNQDGALDVVTGGFFDPIVRWYENPGPESALAGLQWKARALADTGLKTNEASFLRDLDGDGVPEWITNQWNKNNPLLVWRFAAEDGQRILKHVKIGERNGHGMGFGDLNNDGRDDILVGTGWYERPEGDPWRQPWTFHPDWDRAFSCPVFIRDLNGDAIQDVLFGAPHDFGLILWIGRGPDSKGKLQFEEQVVDRSFSQLHCIHFCDLDGDGRDELLTGKRVKAHNGRDPGGKDPAVLCYYDIDDQARFTRREIVRGSVGIGLQIRTVDLDGNGALDIVVAGKEGTQVLLQQSR